MTANARHIFVSHGSENRAEANELTAFLEARGLRMWIAPRDVRPGMDYSEQLQSAIEECAAFLVLVTEKANRSPYVRAETEMAFSLEKPIFPIRVGDVKPGAGLALFLKIKHWTDAFGPDREASLERLAAELQTTTGAGATAAPPPRPAEAPPAPPAADDALVRAFIGPKAAYYVDQWHRMDVRRSGLGWNWPAFLVAPVWLGYRKMWGLMGGIAAAMAVLMLLQPASPQVEILCMLAWLGLAGWLGTSANRLYRRHVDDTLARLDLGRRDRRTALDRAEIAGGVSQGGMWGMIALFLFVLLIVAGIENPQPN